jgi:hypothetical protein
MKRLARIRTISGMICWIPTWLPTGKCLFRGSSNYGWSIDLKEQGPFDVCYRMNPEDSQLWGVIMHPGVASPGWSTVGSIWAPTGRIMICDPESAYVKGTKDSSMYSTIIESCAMNSIGSYSSTLGKAVVSKVKPGNYLLQRLGSRTWMNFQEEVA